MKIDLGQYRSPEVKVFAGRERGQLVRAAARIAKLDQLADMVEVHVPNDVISVGHGFFLAMFGDSIRTLGEKKFRLHYRFTGHKITETIESAIAAVKNTKAP